MSQVHQGSLAVETGPQRDAPTVDRLLDAAATLFWEKGYAATTTREIAAALGIQQASLYHHMASKEELLYQICRSSLEQFVSVVQAAVEEARHPLDRIRALIRAHLTTLLKLQQRNVTMITELGALSRSRRMEVLKLRETYAAMAQAILESAQRQGAVRGDIPARYLCLAMLNMLNWAVLWFRKEFDLTGDQLAEIFVKVFLEGAARVRGVSGWGVRAAAQRPAARSREAGRARENRTLDRLLDAAVALFSRKGYAATSTREVAALLGIQKASLYYHVESKEDLLYAICKSSLEQIHRDVAGAIQGITDPLGRVRALIGAHVESLLRDAAKHSATLAEMRALSAKRLKEVLSLRDRYEDQVRSVLQEAQEAGALRTDIDPKYVCLSLLGLMNRVLVWHRRSGPLTPAQMGELLAVIFLEGALAG